MTTMGTPVGWLVRECPGQTHLSSPLLCWHRQTHHPPPLPPLKHSLDGVNDPPQSPSCTPPWHILLQFAHSPTTKPANSHVCQWKKIKQIHKHLPLTQFSSPLNTAHTQTTVPPKFLTLTKKQISPSPPLSPPPTSDANHPDGAHWQGSHQLLWQHFIAVHSVKQVLPETGLCHNGCSYPCILP